MYRLLFENSNSKSNEVRSSKEKGVVNFSMIKELDSPISFKGLSIKYVFQGTENYRVNGNRFNVGAGEYLLGNDFSEGSVKIGSEAYVKGICVDINAETLSEVVASHIQPGTPVSDLSLDKFFTTEYFFENKYAFDKTHLGQLLSSLGNILDKDPFGNHQFTNDFFYLLSEKIILDHKPILGQLNSINSLKSVTKKDLYRKMLKGKEYIDNNYLSKIEIGTAATEANLSEYHFFRLFKSVYKISPLQYIISKRLEIAKQLLKNKALKLSDIAVITGFSDMHSLSKAFKKHYGVSPSKAITE